MSLTLGKNFDEICYPFIYEQSHLCDFEVITDELCAHIGAILSALPAEMGDLYQDLETLQPLAFHINGSIRGRLAVTEQDLDWVKARLHHYSEEVKDTRHTFVLPRGQAPVAQLNLARSACKKAIRALVRVDQEGIEVPMLVPRMCNALCNLFFIMTLVVNQRRGEKEVAFISKSYGKL